MTRISEALNLGSIPRRRGDGSGTTIPRLDKASHYADE
jgi:hypothetical protein